MTTSPRMRFCKLRTSAHVHPSRYRSVATANESHPSDIPSQRKSEHADFGVDGRGIHLALACFIDNQFNLEEQTHENRRAHTD